MEGNFRENKNWNNYGDWLWQLLETWIVSPILGSHNIYYMVMFLGLVGWEGCVWSYSHHFMPISVLRTKRVFLLYWIANMQHIWTLYCYFVCVGIDNVLEMIVPWLTKFHALLKQAPEVRTHTIDTCSIQPLQCLLEPPTSWTCYISGTYIKIILCSLRGNVFLLFRVRLGYVFISIFHCRYHAWTLQ